jgi:hypothetical protein
MSFETVAQTVIFNALDGNAPLNAIVSGVYDAVPQVEIFPYVTIGEDSINEWDTFDNVGANASITVHTWSRARGRKETKQIQGLIYDALHRQEFSSAGYDVVAVDFEASQSFMDADGLTRHGVSTFRIFIGKA